ncbi:hypothetical protein NU08_2033 [Flavobacterium anhuiense]|uniref:Uncharacterized protein n=1 Tax=Flavobacterium anhuiense TaxID=459526 RepID=A0A444VZ99_9FLAO|nr:hypothetical protein NU08_2033 [Flavobacterium anhuiense]
MFLNLCFLVFSHEFTNFSFIIIVFLFHADSADFGRFAQI